MLPHGSKIDKQEVQFTKEESTYYPDERLR
jgi:hypothetical protein